MPKENMKRILKRNALDISLWILFLICLVFMFKSSTDTRPEFMDINFVKQIFSSFSTGNQIIFDVSVGVIVGLFVYVLVVRVPAKQKKDRIKAHLLRKYVNLKNECLLRILWACGEARTADMQVLLTDRTACKEFFSETVSVRQTRWDMMLDGLSEEYMRDILLELELFRNDMESAITSVDIADEDTFVFVNNLNEILQRSQFWTMDGDNFKPMSRFMWTLFTGWDPVSGYLPYDIVERHINKM